MERKKPVYSDKEILLCAALYAADVEHLLLIERNMLGFVSSLKGMEVKEKEYTTEQQFFEVMKESEHCVHVEREIEGGKSKFFYSLISDEKEWGKLLQKVEKRLPE